MIGFIKIIAAIILTIIDYYFAKFFGIELSSADVYLLVGIKYIIVSRFFDKLSD